MLWESSWETEPTGLFPSKADTAGAGINRAPSPRGLLCSLTSPMQTEAKALSLRTDPGNLLPVRSPLTMYMAGKTMMQDWNKPDGLRRVLMIRDGPVSGLPKIPV